MCQQGCSSSPSSHLDKEQTKSDAYENGVPDDPRTHRKGDFMPLPDWTFGGPSPTPVAVEQEFRHSGWAQDRKRVLVALREAGESDKKIRRFRECGSNAWIEYSRTLNQYRVRAAYCGHRFCKPCAAARSRVVRERIEALCKGHTVRFLTFTRRNVPTNLVDALERMTSPFRNVRECLIWRQAVKGGGACTEIKRGSRLGLWHVHLHVLVIGTLIDIKALRQAWLEITGDSNNVDAQLVRKDGQQISYTAKYASKGWTNEILRCHDDLVECIRALRGRRLFATFGEWWGASVEDEPNEAPGWKVVCRFHVGFAACLRGEPFARGYFHSLGVAPGCISGVPVFIRGEDDG